MASSHKLLRDLCVHLYPSLLKGRCERSHAEGSVSSVVRDFTYILYLRTQNNNSLNELLARKIRTF
jgi:hypothetical protein